VIKSPADIHELIPKTIEEMVFGFEVAKQRAMEDIQKILAVPAHDRTFENTVLTFDKAQAYFQIPCSLIALIKMVHPDDAMRKKAQEILLNSSEIAITLFQTNKDIYKAIKEYQLKSTEVLNDERAYYFSNLLEEFKVSGLELEDDKFARMQELHKQIAGLSLEFQTNIAQANTKIIFSREELVGLGDDFISTLTSTDEGYSVGCDYPTAMQVMAHCSKVETRKKYYQTFKSRAYPENLVILNQIINTRDELAKLLGYKSYVELDIVSTMAQNLETVESFLAEVASDSQSKILDAWNVLMKYLPQSVNLTPDGKLEPWDVAYVSDQYLKNYVNIDHNKIAEYFPMEETVRSLLNSYEKFFKATFKVIESGEFWDPSVQMIEVKNSETNTIIGYVLVDLFPRENKYSHACCSSLVPPMSYDNGQTYAPAFALVIANFSKSTENKPSLLKHGEVKTFFHEFGHAIHALFGKAEMPTTAAYNTKFDFVETPSQLLEEWLWNAEMLKKLSYHYQTGESLPDDLIERLISTRTLKDAINIDSQLQYAAWSLNLYKEGKDKDFLNIKKDAYDKSSRVVAWEESVTNFCSFGHLSGYASKYYTYLWSEQLAKKIFNHIQLNGGLLDPEIGKSYISKIIGRGGSCHPQQMINDFLGNEITSPK